MECIKHFHEAYKIILNSSKNYFDISVNRRLTNLFPVRVTATSSLNVQRKQNYLKKLIDTITNKTKIPQPE